MSIYLRGALHASSDVCLKVAGAHHRALVFSSGRSIQDTPNANVPFIDADYDKDNWFERAKGMEHEPERGVRCTMCLDMRFERTALYAYENNFSVISSSLGISRWKDMKQITDSGIRSAQKYPGITYWDYTWRKGGGSARMVEISKRERFYQQEYCGCIYSLRDTNHHRKDQGRDIIRIGVKYYGDDE